MRARFALTVALLASLALVVFPSEAMVLKPAESVVDQVSSCRAAHGVLGDVDLHAADQASCRAGGPDLPPASLLVAVVAGLVGSIAPAGSQRHRRRDDRWRLPEECRRECRPTRGPPAVA